MGQRLLIVDGDRRFIQDHLAALESAFEVEVLHATDAALSRLETGQYAAVLLCVEVSENKGYSLCSAIRRTPALQELKIALISGKATEEEYARHQSLKGHADLYLHKPIPTHALLAALTPIVPLKAEDPDNPLGDLDGSDLGDEWLESLKTELEVELLAPSPTGFAMNPLPLSHQATQRLVVVPKDAGRVELLEERVKDLEAKLVAKADELDQSLQDLTQLKHQNLAVTRNLDDLEQRQAETELLHVRFQEAQAALAAQTTQGDETTLALRTELEAALAGQQHLQEERQAAETLLASNTERTMEIMDANQLLQAQLEEARENALLLTQAQQALEDAQEQNHQLERNLDQREADYQQLEGHSAQQEASLLELTSRCEEALTARTTLESRFAELEQHVATMGADHERQQLELMAGIDAREAQVGRLNATIEGMREQALAAESQQAENQSRMQALDGQMLALSEVLAELEGKATQALNLARSVTP